jgi:hypothetical protein
VPVASDRWIGVIELPGHFQSHCLVMHRDEVLLDPTWNVRNTRQVRQFTGSEITYGLIFEPKE